MTVCLKRILAKWLYVNSLYDVSPITGFSFMFLLNGVQIVGHTPDEFFCFNVENNGHVVALLSLKL